MNANEPNSNAVVPAGAASPPSFADRKFRQKLRDELRAEEWDMHRELMDAGRAILKYLRNNPHKHTVADLARVMELSSKLARLATQPDCDLDLGDDGAAVMINFRDALRKVYARRESEGRPLPKNVIIDAEMVGGETTPAPGEGKSSKQDVASGTPEPGSLLSRPAGTLSSAPSGGEGRGGEAITPINSHVPPSKAGEGQGSTSINGG